MDRERDIEAWLRRRIEDMGGMFLKFVSPGNAGVPDRLAVLKRGIVVFVELKTGSGVLTSLQSYQIARLRKLKQHAAVVFGMDGAREFLDDLKDLARNGRPEALATIYGTKDFASVGCLMDVLEDDGK